MKKFSALVGAALLIAHASQAQTFSWARQFSSQTAMDKAECTHVKPTLLGDGLGNIYAFGSLTGNVDLNPGAGTTILSASNGGSFIEKLSGAGNMVWVKQFGGVVKAGAVDALGNIYLVGLFSGMADFDPGPGSSLLTAPSNASDAFVIKLDNNGSFLWVRQFTGTDYEEAQSVALDANGNVYVCGLFGRAAASSTSFDASNVLSSQGGNDIFLVSMDAQGTINWVRSWGSAGNDAGNTVIVDNAGYIVLGGIFTGTVDMDADPINTRMITSGPGYDMFMEKLDASGNYQWAKQFGGSSGQKYFAQFAVDAADNIHATGNFSNTMDFDPGAATYNLGTTPNSGNIFFLKLDASGNFAWARDIGGNTAQEFGVGIAVDGAGNVYGTGYFQTTVDFDPGPGTYNISVASYTGSMFVEKLNASGNFVWARRIGGSQQTTTEGHGILLNGTGDITLSCDFNGKIDVDPGNKTHTLTAKGWDYAIIRLTQSSNGGSLAREFPAPGFSVSPNPAVGQFRVHGLIDSKEAESAHLELRDITGRLLLSKQLRLIEGVVDEEVQTGPIPAGVYLLNFITEATRLTKQLVVQ